MSLSDAHIAGRLTATVYPVSFLDQVPLTQMSVTEPPGRTHMYYTGEPEFEFGDGLSYTSFTATLEAPEVVGGRLPSLSTEDASEHRLALRLRNSGSRAGAVKVLAMWRPVGDHLAPLRQKLVGFDGVHLAPAQEGELYFVLSSEHFAVADEDGRRIVYPGEYEVFFKGVGPTSTPVARLSLVGSQRLVEDAAL